MHILMPLCLSQRNDIGGGLARKVWNLDRARVFVPHHSFPNHCEISQCSISSYSSFGPRKDLNIMFKEKNNMIRLNHPTETRTKSQNWPTKSKLNSIKLCSVIGKQAAVGGCDVACRKAESLLPRRPFINKCFSTLISIDYTFVFTIFVFTNISYLIFGRLFFCSHGMFHSMKASHWAVVRALCIVLSSRVNHFNHICHQVRYI